MTSSKLDSIIEQATSLHARTVEENGNSTMSLPEVIEKCGASLGIERRGETFTPVCGVHDPSQPSSAFNQCSLFNHGQSLDNRLVKCRSQRRMYHHGVLIFGNSMQKFLCMLSAQ